jgi:hypothetical protein
MELVVDTGKKVDSNSPRNERSGKKSPESISPRNCRTEKNESNLWAWGQRSFGRLGMKPFSSDNFFCSLQGLGLEMEQDKEPSPLCINSITNTTNPESQIWKAKWQATRVLVQEEFVRFIAVACGSSHSLVHFC